MHPALRHLKHRPWPIPEQPWSWRQAWCNLLFAHWPIPKSDLRLLIPEPLEVQEFDGTAWLGVVPFEMRGVMRRFLPDLPGFSAFPEWNVRTYVSLNGRPGVWFFSLDATNRLAVWGGQRCFHLPYHRAKITIQQNDGQLLHEGSRHDHGPHLEYAAKFAPAGPTFQAEPGSLEHWLTERYCLYAHRPDGRMYRTEVHHRQWPLQNASAELDVKALVARCHLTIEGPPVSCLFAKKVDVVAWNPMLLDPTKPQS